MSFESTLNAIHRVILTILVLASSPGVRATFDRSTNHTITPSQRIAAYWAEGEPTRSETEIGRKKGRKEGRMEGWKDGRMEGKDLYNDALITFYFKIIMA